jgi:hypothetical protein
MAAADFDLSRITSRISYSRGFIFLFLAAAILGAGFRAVSLPYAPGCFTISIDLNEQRFNGSVNGVSVHGLRTVRVSLTMFC